MRIFFLLAITLIFTGCKDKGNTQSEDTKGVQRVNTEVLPERTPLHPMAQKAILQWPKFQEFDNDFSRLYQIENNEDLILVVEDLIEKHQELTTAVPPEEFNTAQIKSRMVVVLTNLHLIKSNLFYGEAVEEVVIKTVTAYNALRSQMNIQVTNTLDTKTILDD